MPVELGFILERPAEMAEQDPSLPTKQPWKAAFEKNRAWLGAVMTRHYQGDDRDVKILMKGVLAAFAGWTVEDHGAAADDYVGEGIHPSTGRAFEKTGYVRMVELLRYLEENGFVTLIASGGNRDFMRGFAQSVYGIPPERVIGSSSHITFNDDERGARLVYEAAPDVFDDGAVKPVRIWSRLGRVPLVAGGNSNG